MVNIKPYNDFFPFLNLQWHFAYYFNPGTVLDIANKATDTNQHWVYGEPNNGVTRNCLMLLSKNGTVAWADAICDGATHGYICETLAPA
jgi:hypothetical protein